MIIVGEAFSRSYDLVTYPTPPPLSVSSTGETQED